MSIQVKVPSMGESITSGILAAWHVKDGDFVMAGQVLYELETDKITSEGQAEASGVISIKAGLGDEVEIGQVIALIDETAKAPGGGVAIRATENVAEVKKVEAAPVAQAGKHEAVSPAVRRIAGESKIEPSTVVGSGKDGRVTKGDMLAAVDKQSSSTSSLPIASAIGGGG